MCIRRQTSEYLSVDREQFFLPISWLSVFILHTRGRSIRSSSHPRLSLVAIHSLSFAREFSSLFANVKVEDVRREHLGLERR